MQYFSHYVMNCINTCVWLDCYKANPVSYVTDDAVAGTMWPLFCLQGLPVQGSRLTVAQDKHRVDNSTASGATRMHGYFF